MASSDQANPVAVAQRPEPSSSAITKSWLLAGIDGSSLHRLGNYDIVARLGQGGMGQVYKARHRNLKRFFAIKTLRSDIDASAESIARFYREMEAIGRIHHPNVVSATDAGPLEGIDCLVMEYLEGVDLASLLRQVDRLPLALACEVIRQAANGLAAISEHALVHRDMKPSNLFICRNGQIKILDLGLARLSVNDDFTRRGEVYGTADYMAPEVAMGLGDYDGQADVYSLGCTFYKALAGLAPFETDEHSSFISKMHAHASVVPPPVGSHVTGLPAEIESLLDRMLAKEPHQRPTAREVATELALHIPANSPPQLARLASQYALVEEPIDDSDSTPLGKSPAGTKPERPGALTRLRETRFGPTAVIAASLVGLLLVGAVMVWAAGSRLSANSLPTEVADGLPAAALDDLPALARREADDLRPATGGPLELVPAAPTMEFLSWNGTDDLSFVQTGDEFNSLFLQTDGTALLCLGETDNGTHHFAVEVQQLDWKRGNWGMFYGYQKTDRNRKLRYERLGCVYLSAKDEFYLVRMQFRHEQGSTVFHRDVVAEVPVQLDPGRNFLDIQWIDHRLSDVRLNGKPLPELVLATEHPPSAGTSKFGVFCANSAVQYFSPIHNGKELQFPKDISPK